MNSQILIPTDPQQKFVLIADDYGALLDVLAEFITRIGLVPLVARDGAAAIAFASRFQPLLVCALMDIQMPIMNGVEAAHAIQRIIPQLAIVLMSGGYPDSLIERINQLRIVTILQKPFSLAQLHATLTQIIANCSACTPAVNSIAEHGFAFRVTEYGNT